MDNERPEYCPCVDDEDPCPACGATLSGNDPVRGICQARKPSPPPYDLVRFVLLDKYTGKQVWP